MPTAKRTLDWYDKNAAQYSAHLKQDKGVFHHAFEKPAMHQHLPALGSKAVLSLGCGSGEDLAYLKSLGAGHCVGIDISEKLIGIAKKQYPDCEFAVMDMEKLGFDDGSFDFVYSSLALHYLPDWTAVMQQVHRVLKPGGEFLFSSSHPTADAMEWKKDATYKELILSGKVKRDTTDAIFRGVYLSPKQIDAGEPFPVTFYHQPLESIFAAILGTGFVVEGFWEPKPTKEMKKLNPHNYALWSELPWLMIMKLQKPA